MSYVRDFTVFFLLRLDLQKKDFWSRKYTRPGGVASVEPISDNVHRVQLPPYTESRRQPSSLQRMAQTTDEDF